jgi:antitoxin ParD1/3/4
MTISLKPEHEHFIQSQIDTGHYTNPDEVISEAFKLLFQRENRLKELQEKIAIGTQQIAQGQIQDGEAVLAMIQRKIDGIADSAELF